MVKPVVGVQRPKEGATQGKTPAISDRDARRLLAAPPQDTLSGKRDRAIIAVFLFHGPRRAEVAGLRVGDLQDRRGVPAPDGSRKGCQDSDVTSHAQRVVLGDPATNRRWYHRTAPSATPESTLRPRHYANCIGAKDPTNAGHLGPRNKKGMPHRYRWARAFA